MTITVEFHGPIAIIILLGGIDYSSQEELRNAIDSAMSAEGVREVQVNLAQIAFMDSSAIRTLILFQKQAASNGKSLVLLDCNDNMRQVFEIGGFDKMFTFRTSR